MADRNGPGGDKGATLIDVIELAESLRQEQLLINNERSSFHGLNETLKQHHQIVTEVKLYLPSRAILIPVSPPFS